MKLQVFSDIHNDLRALEAAIAVAQVHTPLTDGFDLGAGERQAGLERLEDVVIEPGLAVVGDESLVAVVGHHMSGYFRPITA